MAVFSRPSSYRLLFRSYQDVVSLNEGPEPKKRQHPNTCYTKIPPFQLRQIHNVSSTFSTANNTNTPHQQVSCSTQAKTTKKEVETKQHSLGISKERAQGTKGLEKSGSEAIWSQLCEVILPIGLWSMTGNLWKAEWCRIPPLGREFEHFLVF